VIAKLSIGRLAEQAGVGVETIRYYQRRGLIDEPQKPDNGQRRYSEETVERVRYIRRAKALGFTLDEIARLLAFKEPAATCEVEDLALHKLKAIDSKVAELIAMRSVLSTLTSACGACAGSRSCPIIRALTTA